MKLIIGLGNPEGKYNHTRHNVGFSALGLYAQKRSLVFTLKDKFKSSVVELNIGSEKVILAQPNTYYNETGLAARSIIDFYKLDPANDVLVVHDDLALPFGTLRIRPEGSDAGNNGIKSLNAHIGADYHRVRIGIYNDLREKQPAVDFVLGTFSHTEQEKLDGTVLPKVCELIDLFIDGKLEATSHYLDAEQGDNVANDNDTDN